MIPDWLARSNTQEVFRVLNEAGHDTFAVGGCVRNTLMGLAATDIDLATSCPPSEATKVFKAAGHKVIPTGFDHGTITAVVDGTAFEITTFREDIETDGRHAKVLFSDDIADDARRRDFTMNALYMDAGGHLHDPLGGLEDLRARRVRFIGDGPSRVAEDYLRILRFFRFHAQYGAPEHGLDADSLAACAGGVHGLAAIAKERIGQEMRKLLSASDPAPAVAAMRASGVLNAVLLGADDRGLGPFIHLTDGWPIDPIARLASLGGQDSEAALRLSKAEAARLSIYQKEISAMTSAGALGYWHGAEIGKNCLALRSALLETPMTGIALLEKGAKAVFPIKADDLMPRYHGPALGRMLKELERLWIASDFTMNRQELLKQAGQ
ncbi:CCA tRNA nucleotidyltransferase [Nereida sp. MMG025]|uniref:CCA tRNA nucleotidyltransferase n=1 Tax=Nereida sp. MMG025 TaxID=2909981 RepID=UPI001F1C1B7F|nr:CCA tRNA nucleotidyltransferase [Nereida sp. MMG025]MCF6444600.1 CCA tRNA nucleotidyltransferase [Nereida sp. MMG025]